MRLAMIGLGRMGANIARRLMRNGHEIVAFDLSEKAVETLVKDGATGSTSIEDLAEKLDERRIFWVMLPAGEPTESMIQKLLGLSRPGDIIIDGGNTFYKDDIRRAKACAEKQVTYVDVGTSGGVWGLERGYCMMIGGEKEAVDLLDPIFEALAPGLGTIPRTAERKEAAIRARKRAISMPVPQAPGISSRWSTMASNMA
jgi:6-phosphogluconate dehydrogenase